MTQYKIPGNHVISVNHNFGAITDYYPISDSPNGVTGAGGYMGFKHEREKPQIRYTWYDRYLWKRYQEMRRLANEEAKKAGPVDFTKGRNPAQENVYLIDKYALAFFDRYLRDRRYYYGSNTKRE